MKTNNSLLIKLSSKENLQNAWNLLKKENEESHGLSGITINDFDKNLSANLDLIAAEIVNQTFEFSSTRATVIKKDNGKYRPLQIPEIRDRVVLKALAILLEEDLKEILDKSDGVSFAYQQGKGVREAVLSMKSSFRLGGEVILKADIINFFEEVQKNILLNDLIYPNLSDPSLNKLIEKSMSQKLGGLHRLSKKHWPLFKNAGKGIPQGNPLSPLLSNIYLSSFDTHLKENNYLMVRYADDFIVIFKSEEEAKGGYKEISNYLKDRHSLKIHPLDGNGGKTVIINPLNEDFTFLSIKFDGKEIYPGKETLGILKSKITKAIKISELNVGLYKEIYELIKKWIALYSYTDIERYFEYIDSFVLLQLGKKYGNRRFKIVKSYELAQNIRSKQFAKARSFWRNPKLKDILPRFIQKTKALMNESFKKISCY